MAKAREVRKHRLWASQAIKATLPRCFKHDGSTIRLTYTISPKRFGPMPDKDNASAAMKAYQDGIADALGVDDKHFAEPRIIFGDRSKLGGVTVDAGE